MSARRRQGLSKVQWEELDALTRGPRGGRLRGCARPKAREVSRALDHWPRNVLVPTILGLLLSGMAR